MRWRTSFAISGVLIVSAVVAMPSPTRADIIGNIPADPPSDLGTFSQISSLVTRGFGFTLPSNQSFRLDSVTLELIAFSSAFTASPTIQMDVFGDVGGQPGGPSLVSLTHSSFDLDVVTRLNFTPVSLLIMEASKTYWVAFRTDRPASGLSWHTPTLQSDPTGIATFAGYRASDGRVSGISEYPPTTVGVTRFVFGVGGTPAAVPEPSSLALILAAGAFGLLARYTRTAITPRK